MFQVKCDHYWPFTEDPVAYGDITVEMLSEDEHTDWVYRSFRISYVSEALCQSRGSDSSLISVQPFLQLLSISGIQWKTPKRDYGPMIKSQNFPLKLLSPNFSAKCKAETQVLSELWTLLWYQYLLTTNV